MSAFAVFCATDGSLTFYNRDTVPTAGNEFEGKVASNVYTGFDTTRYSGVSSVPWYNEMSSIISVSFMPEFATVKPIATRRWFDGANNMISFNCANFDTSKVTDMYTMFNDCSSLTSLDLSSFNTSNVTDMYAVFRGCSSLTSLDLSSFNTSNVTTMHTMFGFCSSLTSLDLSNFDTSKVTNMSYMFRNCSVLTTIYVSDLWITDFVTSSTYMFVNSINIVGAIPYDSTTIDKTHANYETGYLTYKFYFANSGNRFVVSGADLNRLASAIRSKTGTLDGLTFPDGFVAAIESLGVAATDDGSGNVVADIAGSSSTYSDGNVVIS